MIIALIPAYEPTDTLIKLILELKDKYIDIIVVNDGSNASFDYIFEEAANYAHILKHNINRGKGHALKTGLTYIQNNFDSSATIITLDSDGQHSIKDSLAIAAYAINHPNELTLGSRLFKDNVPARSRFGNSITRFVYKLFTGVKVHDTQTGLRAFGYEMIPFLLKIKGERYEYEMNVLLECTRRKINIHEINIETIYYDNNSGSHFNTVKDSMKIYKDIFKFAASSFIGFVVDYSLYSLLAIITIGLDSAISIPLSNIIARIVSASVNFIINKHFVFKNNDSTVKTGLQYFILAFCILIGNTFLLSILVNYAGINKFIAKLFTEITFFSLSWFIQKFVIFHKSADNDILDKNNMIHTSAKKS